MSELLRDLDGVVCLMDNVLVHGKTVSAHDERLVKVLQIMQKAGMTLNKDKCQFSQKSIMFLVSLLIALKSDQIPEKLKQFKLCQRQVT